MTPRRRVLLLVAAALASVIVVLLVLDRGQDPRSDPVKARPLAILPAVKLAPDSGLERPLGGSWAVSADVAVPHGGLVRFEFGTATVIVRRSRHLEEAGSGPGMLAVRSSGGRAALHSLIISGDRDPAALLLHRLAELHARLRPDQFPEGADRHDHLHVSSTYWTSGFWPGALWQAGWLVRGSGRTMFERWGLAATLAHLGGERADTHDVGFQYAQSSLAAFGALCQRRAAVRRRALCARLEHSALAAANELVALERSNSRAATVPTDAKGTAASTIIDSMMNISILPWASRVTGDRAYAQLAQRHAHRVARLLVRRDGSTAQVVKFDRASGRVLGITTRQGKSASSTWSRGQAWAVYGFAQAAQQLHDPGLLRTALNTAGYVQRHLPPGGIPRWDYDAPAGAPVDVSAGVITAAGLFHLVAACRSLPGRCGSTTSWVRLARRMLGASLAHIRTRPPLGLLPDQVLNQHGHGCWCNGGELIFGLTYALEALRLEGTAGGRRAASG